MELSLSDVHDMVKQMRNSERPAPGPVQSAMKISQPIPKPAPPAPPPPAESVAPKKPRRIKKEPKPEPPAPPPPAESVAPKKPRRIKKDTVPLSGRDKDLAEIRKMGDEAVKFAKTGTKEEVVEFFNKKINPLLAIFGGEYGHGSGRELGDEIFEMMRDEYFKAEDKREAEAKKKNKK